MLQFRKENFLGSAFKHSRTIHFPIYIYKNYIRLFKVFEPKFSKRKEYSWYYDDQFNVTYHNH
jgi:hypothetical protein